MSQLKKQTVVSRKGTRTPQARKAPRGRSLSTGVVGICRATGKVLLTLVLRPFKNSRFRWPVAALALTAALTSGGLIAYTASNLLTGVVEHLPERLEVRCLRIDLREKIAEIASDTLNQAQKAKASRTALMDKLLSRISKLDGVDDVRIRAGLDQRVLIDVTAQTPFLVLQGKGSERVLVGNQFKIIARSLPNGSYNHLPQIETPELALNLSYSGEKREAYDGYFVRPSINAGVNVRWLGQQTINIYALFESERLPLKVEKVVWKEVSGFNVSVEEQGPTKAQIPGVGMSTTSSSQSLSTETQSISHRYNIVLGENDFKEKFSRLRQVIDDLQQKKTVVDQIDLGYSDKAIIKINEQLSELKRGGL